jgi:ABC-2 type transport system permease protein
MSAFVAIVKKELASVARDLTILIAVAIQLFLASFSSALLVGLLALYDADSISSSGKVNIKVGLTGATDSPLAAYLSEYGIEAYQYPTLAEAAQDFQHGKIRAILSLPEDTSLQQPGEPLQMKLFLPSSQATSSLILMVLQTPLKRYENYLRVERSVEVRYKDLPGKPPTTFEFIYSVIIPVLMFFPASVAGGMVVDSLTEEVENNTLETLLSAPVSLSMAASAKITAALILAVMQCIAWIGLLRLNAIDISNKTLVLLLAAIVAGIISVGAALISIVFKDRERSQFVYSLFVLVIMSLSYLLDVSPIKTISRLAIGDYYTGVLSVLGFAAFLAGLWAIFLYITRRMAGR